MKFHYKIVKISLKKFKITLSNSYCDCESKKTIWTKWQLYYTVHNAAVAESVAQYPGMVFPNRKSVIVWIGRIEPGRCLRKAPMPSCAKRQQGWIQNICAFNFHHLNIFGIHTKKFLNKNQINFFLPLSPKISGHPYFVTFRLRQSVIELVFSIYFFNRWKRMNIFFRKINLAIFDIFCSSVTIFFSV